MDLDQSTTPQPLHPSSKRWWMLGGVLVLVVVVVGFFGPWRARDASQRSAGGNNQQQSQTQSPRSETSNNRSGAQSTVSWQFSGTDWRASGQAPTCSDPLVLEPPVDPANVTTILYPGQTRGGNYKPHGGFRFDNATTNAVSVAAPIDGYLVNGARYIAEGSVQYTFDVINACGIMYRLGHLLELTPTFQAIAETFPEAKEGDSRTTFVEPPVFVAKGTQIATATGVTKGPNVFVDWGVYDLRTKNASAADAAWVTKHADDQMLAPYAVCWFDLLSADNEARVRSLPAADPASGKTSDYCR